ncbi:hypothetical protein [Erwinia sp. V71]|uniref:hypothetical protein n=1 Tax=Erwinia sp. V71 TaxID=3369424 RepID=UPI003F645B60
MVPIELIAPSLAKTFTLAVEGELDLEKLPQLHSQMLQHASVMMERMLNMPAGERDKLIQQLSPGHILEEFYCSDQWPTLAGLQQSGEFDRLNNAERARRVVRCELELLNKAGTDLEKVRVDFPLLWQRLQEYRQVLAPYMSMPVPWGKGVAERLARARAQYQDHAEFLDAANKILQQALDDTHHFAGLPASITRKNLSYLLDVVNTCGDSVP